jgi:hypothetical protein
MTKTGTTTVIMVVMVDGVIMMDGVIEGAVVDGGRVPILASTLDRLTPPTGTMRILLHMGITDTLHTGTTTDTRTEDCPRTPRWRAGLGTYQPCRRTKHLYRQGRQ